MSRINKWVTHPRGWWVQAYSFSIILDISEHRDLLVRYSDILNANTFNYWNGEYDLKTFTSAVMETIILQLVFYWKVFYYWRNLDILALHRATNSNHFNNILYFYDPLLCFFVLKAITLSLVAANMFFRIPLPTFFLEENDCVYTSMANRYEKVPTHCRWIKRSRFQELFIASHSSFFSTTKQTHNRFLKTHTISSHFPSLISILFSSLSLHLLFFFLSSPITLPSSLFPSLWNYSL